MCIRDSYRRKDGKYFIHFEGGKYSEYSVKIGYNDFVARSGNYFIHKMDLKRWKESSLRLQKNNPIEYMVIDWEKEEDESILNEIKLNDEYIMAMGKLSESELPF